MKLVASFGLIIIGIVCHMIVSRNKFYRMSSGGVEQFSSYSKMLMIKFVEKILFSIEVFSFLGGTILFVIWYTAK